MICTLRHKRFRGNRSTAIILMVGLLALLTFSSGSATSNTDSRSIRATPIQPGTTAYSEKSRTDFEANGSTLPLAVNITNPANGSQFPPPATISLAADATDPDGILKVDFFHGSTLLASDNTFPYGFTWTNVPACTFFLTAKATNNLGASATSSPVLISVTDGIVGESTPPNFKIAFMSDQGLGPTSVAALNLVKNEGAQALLVSGDLDYADNPAAWEAQLNSTVGPMFPVLALAGNHDEAAWNGPTGYQRIIEDRFVRIGMSWCGALGVQSALHYKGIFFVFTTPGLNPIVDLGNNDDYIRSQLAADHSVWSISSWHKNMHLMQAGGKSDETGWEVYEESRAGGAIIINGHEHSYFRTHLLSSMINQTVASASNSLAVTKGNSFVAVSGLGGQSRRNQEVTGPWIARIYATPCLPADPICVPNAVEGALFGVFNVNGQMNKANFYFKDVNGQIIDSFTVISDVDMPSISSFSPTTVAAGGGDFTLTVNGANFIDESRVRINGNVRPTTFINSTQLTAQITAADIAISGLLPVSVINAITGGGTSNQMGLFVTHSDPTISFLTPASAMQGQPDLNLTVTGTGFVSGSVVRFNGLDHVTTFISATTLSANIPAADLALAGIFPITVVNPPPGGGSSNTVGFMVQHPNPVPYVSSISPTSGIAGEPDFTLTVNGGVFNDRSIVRWNASDRPTTFVNPGQLTAQISAADIATAGSASVMVFIPAPGGGSSNSLSFTIGCGGYEGDVAPRPNGNNNGTVTIIDWVQLGRFSAGLDTPGCCEFQRADCSPRSTLGNGVITVADWVQGGRYATGLDPTTPTGGPTCPTPPPIFEPEKTIDDSPEIFEAPVVQLEVAEVDSGAGATVQIVLNATGGENALGLSLDFLPSQLRFVSASTGPDASAATLVTNSDQAAIGSLGISLVLPPGHRFAPGRRQLVLLTFESFRRDRFPGITFADAPVKLELVNVNADVLSAKFVPLSSDHTAARLIVLLDSCRLFPGRPYASLLDFLTDAHRTLPIRHCPGQYFPFELEGI